MGAQFIGPKTSREIIPKVCELFDIMANNLTSVMDKLASLQESAHEIALDRFRIIQPHSKRISSVCPRGLLRAKHVEIAAGAALGGTLPELNVTVILENMIPQTAHAN